MIQVKYDHILSAIFAVLLYRIFDTLPFIFKIEYLIKIIKFLSRSTLLELSMQLQCTPVLKSKA